MKFLDWYRDRRRRRALAIIRFEMKQCGCDTSTLTDDEVEAAWVEGNIRMTEGLSAVALSAADAAAALGRLADAIGALDASLIAASWPQVVLEDILDAEYLGEE